jgi:chemotaxis protein MotB
MWLLGATTEKQRKALADYFSPTLIQSKQDSAGAFGPFGGDSLIARDNYPHAAAQTGKMALTIPRGAKGGPESHSGRKIDERSFTEAIKQIEQRLRYQTEARKYLKNLRFTITREGLQIDMVDEADFSMFLLGTNRMTPQAITLLRELAPTIADMPNGIIIRGHTDAAPYSARAGTNNWELSATRAEATRKFLMSSGVAQQRFQRIEGVADRQPYIQNNPYDGRNRRMSITLGWRQ